MWAQQKILVLDFISVLIALHFVYALPVLDCFLTAVVLNGAALFCFVSSLH